MHKELFVVAFLLLCFALSSYAQTVSVINNRRTVVVEFGRPIPPEKQQVFQKAVNYAFYELFDPKGINIRAIAIPGLTVNDVPRWQLGDTWLVLPLSEPLKFGTVYLLKIDEAKLDGKEVPVLRFELGKEAVVRAFNDPRNRMRLESNVELDEKEVELTETTLKVSSDKTTLLVEPTHVDVTPRKVTPTQMNLTFKDRLSEARSHYFKVKLQTADGLPLIAKTKIIIAGLPAPNPEPSIDVRLSSEFGGNLKPQFNLSGVFKRLFWRSENHRFHFEPAVYFDVGLGATKSKNAIILDLPIIKHTIDITNPSQGCKIERGPPRLKPFEAVTDAEALTEGRKDVVALPCYYEWSNRSLFSLYSIDLKAGPKFETDKTFGRVNALGSVRFDFNFDRWQHSIANQRAYLEMDLNNSDAYRGTHKDVYLTTGFTATPRIGFVFGRKLTGEVIQNKTGSRRHVIPQFPIFRSYVGIANVYEWNYRFLPMRFTLTQDLLYLGYTETFGEAKDNVLNIRRIRGFHPYSKAAIDIAFDPARRYLFTISYENGRSAPNFEYLNTVKTGIRVVY